MILLSVLGLLAAIGYTAACRNNQLDEVTALVDAGAGAGTIEIRSGTRPADADTAKSGTLLATCTFSDPSAPAASSGVLTANAITDDSSADATGTASWFRVEDSNDNAVYDGDVGTSGSDLNLNSVAISAGATVSITSWVITGGNA